jgi:hypothetical protein
LGERGIIILKKSPPFEANVCMGCSQRFGQDCSFSPPYGVELNCTTYILCTSCILGLIYVVYFNISAPSIPSCYKTVAFYGFVEELVVNDDPEYQVMFCGNLHEMFMYVFKLILFTKYTEN